jgi:hypothetical protein
MATDQLASLFLRRCLRAPLFSPLSSTKCLPQRHRSTRRAFSATVTHQHSNGKRHRRKLALPQAPSFAQKQPAGPKTSHIIFNPPPSMPNVYHTPLKFLPKNDPRRELYSSPSLPSMYNLPGTSPVDTGRYSDFSQGFVGTPIAKPGTALHDLSATFPAAMGPRLPEGAPLPPPVPRQWTTDRFLTQEEVDEIRQLRTTDSKTWTVTKLKAKFGCAAALIKAIAAPKEAHVRHEALVRKVKRQWSQGRVVARRDREIRKTMWSRDM